MPDGWSVDVDGQNVVMTFPAGDDSGRRVLSRDEARVLRYQLELAYFLAGRNRFSLRPIPSANLKRKPQPSVL
jgi:hypothetical protein